MELCVRRVIGRYPSRRAILRSENITAQVTSHEGTRFRIRLDDHLHPDAWLDLIVELVVAPPSVNHELCVCSPGE